MPAYMRNTGTDRIYVYDPEVFKRRKSQLEIVYGEFNRKGEFTEEKPPTPPPEEEQLGLATGEDQETAETASEIEEVPPVKEVTPEVEETEIPAVDPSVVIDKINKLRTHPDIAAFAMKKLETLVDKSMGTKAELKEKLIAIVRERAKEGNIF